RFPGTNRNFHGRPLDGDGAVGYRGRPEMRPDGRSAAAVAHQPTLDGVEGQLEPVGHAELVVDPREVVFDRLLADGALARHLPVAQAGHEGGYDRGLARGEPETFALILGRGHLAAHVLDAVAHLLAPHPI